jgi:hypothetical protein
MAVQAIMICTQHLITCRLLQVLQGRDRLKAFGEACNGVGSSTAHTAVLALIDEMLGSLKVRTVGLDR